MKIYYGWYVVAVAMLFQAVTFGLGSYAFTFWVEHWMQEFSVGRGDVMWATTVFTIALGVMGPVAGWGLAMERRQLAVNTETFETSEPGIYAVGDINTYPGKKKLIVCGFHEATLAAYGLGARLYPERQGPLQYTTASPRLHRLLGVDTPAAG